MATIQIESDEIAALIRPAVQEAIKDVVSELQKTKEIKMLGRKEIMQIFGCSGPVATQIMKQLPKVKDVGYKCVPEHWLRKWIDENIQWIEGNTGYFGDFEKSEFQEVI